MKILKGSRVPGQTAGLIFDFSGGATPSLETRLKALIAPEVSSKLMLTQFLG